MHFTWWRHQMETFTALLAICAGKSPVPVSSLHKGQWRGALMFSLICARINGWVNDREAGDLRCHRALYDVIMIAHFTLPHIAHHNLEIFIIYNVAEILTTTRDLPIWYSLYAISNSMGLVSRRYQYGNEQPTTKFHRHMLRVRANKGYWAVLIMNICA